MFQNRRSVRRYTDRDVEEDKLMRVVDAARWAPSWGNTQCGELIIVRDQTKKSQLSEILSKKNPASLAVKNAPVVLAVCAVLKKAGFYNGVAITKFEDWFMFDLGLMTQSICLSAYEEGLGTVIVGAFEHDQANDILALPQEHEVVVLIPLGYPDQQPPAPKRKTLEDFTHNDQYGG